MENCVEKLDNCQQLIYKGFISTQESGITWLNEFCSQFRSFCNRIQKFLLFDCVGQPEIIESCFLCLKQILTCVKFLEKAIRSEEHGKIVLASTRQYFLDRIVCCLAYLKSNIKSIENDDEDVIYRSAAAAVTNKKAAVDVGLENNFVSSLDTALDIIEPYSSTSNTICYGKANISNYAEYRAEAMFQSHKLKDIVETLISQALAFSQVAVQGDHKAISALCQKVLRECLAFEEECSLNRYENEKPNEQNRQLRAGTFEQALFQLEDIINESLLRLVFRVLVDITKENPIDKIRQLVQRNIDGSHTEQNVEIEKLIDEYDKNLDRIMQIGIFAIAFAPNIKMKTIVQSCLASLESLDSSLIAALHVQCIEHSRILAEHYNEEISIFTAAIQEIIDTNAFCTCYRETIANAVKNSTDKLNIIHLSDIVQMGKVLYQHFVINDSDLKLNMEPVKERFVKFDLILSECEAIIDCADQVEASRIIKRLNILKSTVKKLQKFFDKTKNFSGDDGPNSTANEKLIFVNQDNFDDATFRNDDPEESKRFFESYGIQPFKASILYGKKANITDSLKGNTSIQSYEMNTTSSHQRKSSKMKKRVSLRIQMFKRQKLEETECLWKSYNENSTNLQITDILDQITNLSTTFTKS